MPWITGVTFGSDIRVFFQQSSSAGMELTFEFSSLFLTGLYALAPVLLGLAVSIVAIGQVVRKVEGWSITDSLYWSFITASTVGYGDFRPTRRLSKYLAILIALIGLILTGIMVAIAVFAATEAITSVGL
jgi:voltage-gated potassium channel